MGQEVTTRSYAPAAFDSFRRHLAAETADLTDFARQGGFNDPRYRFGFELEAWLVDHAGYPSPVNEALLDQLALVNVVPELSKFNVELNGLPQLVAPGAFLALEDELADTWARTQDVAHGMDTSLAMIGILPTVRDQDLCLDNMSALNRYVALNEQVLKQRDGKPVQFCIEGEDTLCLNRRDVMLEAATTSFQFHMQVPEADSGRYYNAAIVAAAPILAVSCNSPLLFGHRLWQETRIPLFEQAIEIGGHAGLSEPTIRRVTLGRGYVEKNLLELFVENEADYPVLLPEPLAESPDSFPHVRLHNGCIWRWVRPLIGRDSQGVAHVRIEHRVLPSGPSIIDMMANAALCLGLTHGLATLAKAPEIGFGFAQARSNFYDAAKRGLESRLDWIDGRSYCAGTLLNQRILPLAREGLSMLKIGDDEIERYLSIIAARLRTGQTGAVWQLRQYAKCDGDPYELMAAYLENQRTGMPVHEWTL